MAGFMHKVCNEQQRGTRRVCADIPECLDWIIDRAMQKDKQDCYLSGADMAAALRQCRSRNSTAARASQADDGSDTVENRQTDDNIKAANG